MKRKQFNISVVLFLFVATVFAQKSDKKITEQFTTNKDVVVEINASNAEINVETWSKNKVAVEATVEVEGLSKEEAEKYLNNWKFEALGNKSKVVINANGNNFHSFGRNNFVHFNTDTHNFPIVIPEMPEIPEFPEIMMLPEFAEDFEIIVLPEEELELAFKGIEEIDFDFDKYAKEGGDYFIQWKDGVNDVTIKSKKEWEAFKKTKKYKKFKESMKKSRETMKKSHATMLKSRETREKHREIAEKSREEAHKKAREAIEKSRLSHKKHSKEIREALAKAQKSLKKSKLDFMFLNESGDITINGKKVKITKKITIKVPKDATFDLNTRHSKVKLPKGKTSGKVSYGTFNSEGLNGGKLNISYSPVTIADLNACTLFLNNVTDAKIASVTNSKVNTSSSGLIIENIDKNVSLKNEFGELTIDNFQSNFGEFNITLMNSEAILNLGKTKTNFKYQTNKIKLDNKRVNTITRNAPKDNVINVFGGFSSLVIK
ncbi:hypothetical protein [Tenacibaculum todarodis]|nr:hypothetical protein [Tenacibaculum todarodis]